LIVIGKNDTIIHLCGLVPWSTLLQSLGNINFNILNGEK